MEWVTVRYPRDRFVFIDGQMLGSVNQILAVGEGTHEFTLGLPADYTPDHVIRSVSLTAPDNPLIIDDFVPRPI
jgi:hypothetical protein